MDTEAEYIVFSCPKCHKRRKTFSINFDKKIKCSCGHLFGIGSGNDIAFEQVNRPVEQMNRVVENYASPDEIPPSRNERQSYQRQIQQQSKIESDETNDTSDLFSYSPPKASAFSGVLLFDFLVLVGVFAFMLILSASPVARGGMGGIVAFGGFMYVFIVFLFLVLPTLIAYLAEEKTGHVWIWFFVALALEFFFWIGVVLQIVIIVILLCLPKRQT